MEASKLAGGPRASGLSYVIGMSQHPHFGHLWVFGQAKAQTLDYGPSIQGNLSGELSTPLRKVSLLSSLTFYFIHLVLLTSHSGYLFTIVLPTHLYRQINGAGKIGK